MKPTSIAIVGMAGRFPGARNTAEFWQNLRNGVESIRDRSDAELLASGASSEDLANPDYVRRAAILDDVPLFDASFFGLNPRDASIMDPQHRHFLECAWEALEDAAHPPEKFSGSIAVFAGSGMNTYLLHNLLPNRKLVESAGLFQLKQTGNDKDVLATRVSYELDLRGPSVNVQTACSTSLVAVHMACQSLLNFECDMALAGGVTIEIPHGQGYIYREGEILSRDGHCRSFDASSSGTVFSSGLGIVVLRRLEDALADHDHIHAVILGSAINNDGARKVGYLAPSVEGQAEVVAEALEYAGVPADSIAYVETHGTGTRVGDPIEVRALAQAFRKSSTQNGYCAIGSLKSSIGHLDAAAGVAGLIKTVLALEHAQIPASLHFETINPHIDLAGSPFYVNNKLADWPTTGPRRRAGVTSLGIGGTNAHVVLEEAPLQTIAPQKKPYQVLTASAKTASAANQAVINLATHLTAHPEIRLGDAAFTCQLGRATFPHRRALVVEDDLKSIAALSNLDRKKLAADTASRVAPVFLFSGQGSQYVNMGRELYEQEPVFHEALDLCAQYLDELLGINLIQALFPSDSEKDACTERLNQTWLTQPALFAIEYAMAQWWISFGVKPVAMAGHSIGEYVAACLAEVFSLKDALSIVATRGRLLYDLPAGSMLAVPLAPAEIRINGTLSLAAINNPSMCVVSGPSAEIAAYEESLSKQSIACRRLFTSHAFHSAMMDPVLNTFEERLLNIELQVPRIPYLSNVTGTWIKAGEATDPAYWARHIRSTVRFSDNLAELFRSPERVLIETGPGNVLTTLARQQGGVSARAFSSLPHPQETVPALRHALETLGRLWTLGVDVDWSILHAPGSVQRASLPTYPFEHQKFWIDPDRAKPALKAESENVPSVEESELIPLYRRVWKPAPLPAAPVGEPGTWLFFRDALGVADQVAAQLKAERQEVIMVDAASSYKQQTKGHYSLRPAVLADYNALIADLQKSGKMPQKIVHLWSVTPSAPEPSLDETLNRSFYSPLYLAQAIASQDLEGISVAFVSNRMQQVEEEPIHNPGRAVLMGPARVISKELPGISSCVIDLDLAEGKVPESAIQLIAEMTAFKGSTSVAWRHGVRFTEATERFDLSAAPERRRLVRGGVYLITGGLGALGLTVAAHLAREFQARLVLVGRSALLPDSQWESALGDAALAETERDRIRKLLEIRSLAGGLLVVHADVTSRDEMRAAVEKARQQFGKINGVFHAAGILDDGPLMLKTASSTARVLDPKVRGTLVLEESLRGEPLDCFVLFSSISSILAPAGQVDYVAANAFLDAFAASRKGPVTAVNWGAWSEIGMASRSASPHPWLEERLLDSPSATVYSSRFSQQRQWVLAEHRFKNGTALIPGSGYLELVAGAFMRGSFHGAAEFRDVYFLAPMMCSATETKEVRVELRREQEAETVKNAVRFSVFARSEEWTEHATGIVAPFHFDSVSSIDCAAIAERCRKRTIVFDEQRRTLQERQFEFGPRWHSLRRIRIGKDEGLAEIELDEKFSAEAAKFFLHPALLDMATGCSLYLTEGYERTDDLYLPFSYNRLSLFGRLPSRFFSHIRARRENVRHGEVETFDITLFDEHDQVLAEIDGFSMRRLTNQLKYSEKASSSLDVGQTGSARPIEIAFRPGIPPLAGARILTRILTADTPALITAVAQPLADLKVGTPDPVPSATKQATAGSEPDRDNVEATLASWWQELLGVEQVRHDDDFFLLGGHSLIGIRLFAKIKKTFQVDLELAVLFEARTLRQLADRIRELQQPAAAKPKSWTCLIPIQPNGLKVPLFCVHAGGGDVLFYEQLATALGPNQPFYAFQSPYVTQSNLGEMTIEEFAALYIKEMRDFYPKGPYLLGGASFGGLVAYEMAQQLCAQGVEPPLLILFDTLVPGSGERMDLKAKVSTFGQNIQKEGARFLFRKATEEIDYWRGWFVRRYQHAAYRLYRFAGWDLPSVLRYSHAEKMHWRTMMHINFRPYTGKVVLMRAVDAGFDSQGKLQDPTLGWGALVKGGLEIFDVSGDHYNVISERNVGAITKKIETLLEGIEVLAV
jgi:acyl transferase domain-containing protein/thioesterase domain-containing protein